MKRFASTLTAVIFTAFLLVVAGCAESSENAEMATADMDASMENDWIVLFDGSNFDHWRGYQEESMPEGWDIEGEAMYNAEPGHDLVTKDTYTDFELEFEWKVGEGGNSGVMYRVGEGPAKPYLTGPEYQILDNVAHTDGKNTLTSAASNYAVNAPTEDATHMVGDWNMGKILVQGNHVEHWLNGIKVVDYELGSEDWKEGVAASKWANVDTYGSLPSGLIALQGDHSSVWYRNIRIRPIG